MRLSRYALAAATALLCRCSLARPMPSGAESNSGGIDVATIQWQSPETDEERLKYFHEPGGAIDLGHYDRRYFHGRVSDEERETTQSHMIRAYLDFFRMEGLDTWLAHGTLLGWWWNGKRFPWDYDLDTQVSDATLKRLGEKYNQTRHFYSSSNGDTRRQYLLDVNPHIYERHRGNGMNVIDARWIDLSNGLFIDITGLSETNPTGRPDTWNCKNYHFYKITELYPMRTTMFEGVEAKVPYAYDTILTTEYSESALINTEFNGHRWDSQQRLWVKTEQTLRLEAEERQKLEFQTKAIAQGEAKLD